VIKSDNERDWASFLAAHFVRAREGHIDIRSYRDLEAWQLAMDLADLVYTIRISSRDRAVWIGLSDEKACVSIPSNIAEGSRHRTPGYISRVIIALGEHAELETQA
jgi:hypothetical protein